MISIIAFILTILGCLNWFCIGFFQYDFVAGLFGYQGSIFSRIVYIIIGIASIWLTYVVIKYRGKITIDKVKKDEKEMLGKKDKDDTTSEKEEVPEKYNEDDMNFFDRDNSVNNEDKIDEEKHDLE